jgi:putative flippase GtrA
VTTILAASAPKLSSQSQIRRFVLVGAGTVSVDYAALYAMTSRMHVGYLISTAVAFMVASTLNYPCLSGFHPQPQPVGCCHSPE